MDVDSWGARWSPLTSDAMSFTEQAPVPVEPLPMKECPACLACAEDADLVCPRDGTALNSAIDGPAVIDTKYRLERRIGTGGMGVVYKAEHTALKRTVAVKLLLQWHQSDGIPVARFRAEAEALGRLEHPAIVNVLDFGVDSRGDGLPYLVMQYLEGETLAAYSRKHGALSLGDVVRLLRPVADALDLAHSRGILHRDVKLANLFRLQAPDGDVAVKVLDFGIARLAGREWGSSDRAPAEIASRPVDTAAGGLTVHPWDAETRTAQALLPKAGSEERAGRLTTAGGVIGTLSYLAPEVLEGNDASPAADVYSFALVAYELLAGREVFSDRDPLQRLAHPRIPVPTRLNPSLSQEVEDVVMGALSPDPAVRPSTAGAFMRALEAAGAIVARRTWASRETPRRLGLALLLAGLVVGLTWLASDTFGLPLLDNRLVDWGFRLASARAPDPRLIILTFDDAALAQNPASLADRVEEFTTYLSQVFDCGASAIAVDSLLPSSWSHSQSFSTFLLKHADVVTLAALATDTGRVVGPEAVNALTARAIGPQGFGRLFGLVNLPGSADGVYRQARLVLRDDAGEARETFARRATRTVEGADAPDIRGVRRALLDPITHTYLVDYRIDWRAIPKVSLKDVPLWLETRREAFEKRLVLVAGEFAGSGDEYPLPAGWKGSGTISGQDLQALSMATILDRFPVVSIRRSIVLALTCLIAWAVSFALLRRRAVRGALAATGIALMGFVGLAVLGASWGCVVLPVAQPVSVLLVVVPVARWAGVSLGLEPLAGRYEP